MDSTVSASVVSESMPDLRKAPRPVAHTAVTFEDTFWAPRLRTIREHSLPIMYEEFSRNGHFAAYRGQWQNDHEMIPYVFWESEVTKWLEAASYSLATNPDPVLGERVDEVIALIASIQQPDGYLNVWFTQIQPEKRWTNLRDWHELYCAGHLIEAAVAHFGATGKRTLLDVVCRYADHIDSMFGREEGKRRGYCGHEEIELALVKLYRATHEERYLRLAQYFIDERGQQPIYFDEEARARGENPGDFWAETYEYCQANLPVREQDKVVGHAVRAMYLYSALADLAKELDDHSLLQTCQCLWQHLTSTRIYLTGGIGSSADNEGVTADYDLPNTSAYAETCAAVGLVQWNHRMLQLDTNARYADLLERALYNGVLSGLALDGSSFFYENPLESHGDHHRQPWYRCSCCPPNVARLLNSLGSYVYSTTDSAIFIHLYATSTAVLHVAGQQVTVRQETAYPWDGAIQIQVDSEAPAEFGLSLRIPGWSREARLTVNGEAVDIADSSDNGYVHLVRRWQAGDQIALHLEMPIERIYAHPDVGADSGRVALQRGPLVYCLETADNVVPLQRIRLPESAGLESQFISTLLGGITVIRGMALALATDDWSNTLYRSTAPQHVPHELVAIPYFAWDNRQPGEMSVWISSVA